MSGPENSTTSAHRRRTGWLRRTGRLGLVLLVALLLLLAVVLIRWRHVFFQRNLHPVLADQVWRSSQPDPDDLAAWQRDLGLASVLCLRGADDDEDWWLDERAAAAALGLDLRAVELDAHDMAGPEALLEVVRHLETAPRPLLLHCMAGVERTGLGSALALLLDGADVATARGQWDQAFGYSPLTSETRHPQVLDQYERWLGEQGVDHTPERFKAWLARDYVADFYAADLAIVSWPDELLAGQGGELTFSVTNTSVATIGFRATPERGVHARIYLGSVDREPPWRHKLRCAEVDLDLLPGERTTFTVTLPPFPAPGPHALRLALVDEDVAFFRDRGARDLVEHFEVRPAP